MKLALLSFSFLLLAFIAKPSPSKAEPVLDTNNNPLLPGSEYYVSPYLWPSAGGLRLARIGNSDCPVDIVREPFNVFPKLETPDCAPESSKWILPLNSASEPSFVRIGVAPPLIREAFQIKRVNEISFPTYKFVYKSRSVGTFDIGIKSDEYGNLRLAPIVDTDDSIQRFSFIFVKASEEAKIRMKTA